MATLGRIYSLLPAVNYRRSCVQLMYCRHLTTSPVWNAKKKKPPPEVKPPGKMKFGIIKKYMSMLERVEGRMERKYPKAYKIYMLFKIGMKDFLTDFKMYYNVSKDLWQGKKLGDFSRQELDIYRQFLPELLKVGPIVILLNLPITDMITPLFVELNPFILSALHKTTGNVHHSKTVLSLLGKALPLPSDMVRVCPVLLISLLPFMNYVIFPVAYFFPRHLLCRHFWTPQQRLDFGHYYVNHRVAHYPKILGYMIKHSRDIKDPGLKKHFEDVINQIEADRQPAPEQITAMKPLFIRQPFGLDYLEARHKIHKWHLVKSMNLSTWNLARDVLLLHHIDLALIKEGVDSLTMEQLQQSCFVRGLDARGASKQQLEEYLHSWNAVSAKVDETSLSLLLHTPTFLAINHPCNRPLLKDRSFRNIQLD